MSQPLRFIVLVLIVIAYSAFQSITYYSTHKAERALINSKLEYNLKSLENHPIDVSVSDYDKEYGTTLGLYGKPQTHTDEKAQAFMGYPNMAKQELSPCLDHENCTQQELIAITKELINANNEEPFWGLNAIMKCFVLPLLAIIVGAWLIKKLKI